MTSSPANIRLPTPQSGKPRKLAMPEFAVAFVRDQIARGLPAEGLTAIHSIVILQKGLLAHYRDYRAAQTGLVIDLALVEHHIEPAIWQALTKNQRAQLDQLIVKEVAASTRELDKLIKWLEDQLRQVQAAGHAYANALEEFEQAYLNPTPDAPTALPS